MDIWEPEKGLRSCQLNSCIKKEANGTEEHVRAAVIVKYRKNVLEIGKHVYMCMSHQNDEVRVCFLESI